MVWPCESGKLLKPQDPKEKQLIVLSSWSFIRTTTSLLWIWSRLRNLLKHLVHQWIVETRCSVLSHNNNNKGELKAKTNVDASCVFCKDPRETRDHLFFSCPYSRTVWKELVSGLLLNNFTEKWLEIMTMLTKKDLDKTKGFIVRYVFQNTIHSIWRERNDRRHGEQPSPTEKIVKLIDKNLRNRLSTIRRGGDEGYAGGLQMWFASRQH